jgi:AraC family transcriptional activator of pobA
MEEPSRTLGRSSIDVDRLADSGMAVEVLRLSAGQQLSVRTAREPHRHDYHELIWVRSGSGEHRIDGQPVAVQERAINIIGRGQVHVFVRADEIAGAVIRFRDEVLFSNAGDGHLPTWLFAGSGGLTVSVPVDGAVRLDGLVEALASEVERPPDGRTPSILRHLLSTLLLWIERWYDDSRTERRDVDDREVELHRRFAQLLERDFSLHHDAAHYAAELAVPQAALPRALSQTTGRATKDLVIDRVMIEAARLLRFTDHSVQQVAAATGFGDPFHFSRLFKRKNGVAPAVYRDQVRGREHERP